MQDYFIWNGTDCRQYGIHVTEQPPITIPAERTTQTNVPGRPGSLTQLEGEDIYDDMILSAVCFISDPARIPAIAAWLKGSGTVTFANRTGGYYKARIANQIPFEKVLRGNPHRSFAVNFRCFPFFYADDAADITVTVSGTIITNPGSVYAEPKITVCSSGNITLMIGMQIVELQDVDGSIIIDSVLQEAYKEDAVGTSILQNEKMSGEFPILRPGANAISWTGDVNLIVITPNWRYL
jgi:phage-related protein